MEGTFTVALDRIELSLLRHLQRDGRLTNADLAKLANISPATCHRRMQELLAEGHIRSVRANLSPRSVDRGALVMVGVVLDRSTPESIGSFAGEGEFLR